jgi:outer membrane lipoprotein SlyB
MRTFRLGGSVLPTLALTALVTGCATEAPHRYDSRASHYGVVESIRRIDRGESSGVGGAIAGGVVGGVIGNQVGSGDGRKLATAAGAVGGAVIGSNIQKRNSRDTWVVTVRMNDGDRERFEQRSIDGLRPGKRVRVYADHVVPR